MLSAPSSPPSCVLLACRAPAHRGGRLDVARAGDVLTPYRNGDGPLRGRAAPRDRHRRAGGRRWARRSAGTVSYAGVAGSPGLTVAVRADGRSTPPTCTCRRPPSRRAQGWPRARGSARSAPAGAARSRRRTCISACAERAPATPTAIRSTSCCRRRCARARRRGPHRRPAPVRAVAATRAARSGPRACAARVPPGEGCASGGRRRRAAPPGARAHAAAGALGPCAAPGPCATPAQAPRPASGDRAGAGTGAAPARAPRAAPGPARRGPDLGMGAGVRGPAGCGGLPRRDRPAGLGRGRGHRRPAGAGAQRRGRSASAHRRSNPGESPKRPAPALAALRPASSIGRPCPTTSPPPSTT